MSPPIDVSTARRAGFAVTVALLAGASPAAAAEWAAPVGGAVTRGFDLGPDPFEGGRHRGADFAALPGTAARAACDGRVLVAGRVGANGRVVTLRCGRWRVTHLPLADVAVRPGAVVDRGTRIGTVSRSRQHDGIHLGVRREGARFGYADPLRFLARDRPPPPLGAVPPRGTRPPLLPPGRPAPEPRPVRLPVTPEARVVGAGSSPVRPGGAGGLAPWPAWAGLALLLAGAIGAGAGWWPRRRACALPHAPAQEVR